MSLAVVQRVFVGTWLVVLGSSACAASPDSAPPAAPPRCDVDLARVGEMQDILSNALIRGLHEDEPRVAAFLQTARVDCADGPELLRKSAVEFDIDEAALTAEVERFRHVNCDHGDAILVSAQAEPDDTRPEKVKGQEGVVEGSAFARDVTLHVVLHELGHALVREFDLPVLGNEETMADAFATHYLTTELPDRAVDVLKARTTSLMIEAREVPPEEWDVSGEHDNDARRAFQIAALAVAADADKYDSVAKGIGMSEGDIRKAKDYGAEIHRSWRRILAPLWMPDGLRSNEARVVCDPENESFAQVGSVGLATELESIVTRFDWHSQVTIRFAAGDGGGAWSRSNRTVTVHSEYLRRFVEQGKIAGF